MAATTTGRPRFEVVQPSPPPQTTTYATLFNSNTINLKQSALINSKTTVKSIEIIHGEPTITILMEERQDFMIEQGLHQAVVFKLSHGAPDLKRLRSILSKHLGTKVNYLLYNGEEHQCRGFPWSIGYNPKEETTLAVVWISLQNLSPNLFAKKSLLSIASEVGKPIAIDKATQIKSRTSINRVKDILDLMEKLPNHIRLQFVDGKSSKLIKGGTPRVWVDTLRVGSGQKLMNSGQKVMDTSDVKEAENYGQHVLQVENENPTKNWTLVAHKKSNSSKILSPTGQNNSSCSEKGSTKNFHYIEKRQDTSNASRDLLCSNSFDALLRTIGKQIRLIENDNDLIQEKTSPTTIFE
ncbi:hypothetical protein H5410_021886 [Solanum commersonii]|uniref:DUF4283 domain-containing protein n=1 Tax=Solanum commersonii TaxID=4109 RepID=A0A9J5ZDT7_SOLCO|nr:hypothetical protein H5410_021886 [Solanum commersonii]